MCGIQSAGRVRSDVRANNPNQGGFVVYLKVAAMGGLIYCMACGGSRQTTC